MNGDPFNSSVISYSEAKVKESDQSCTVSSKDSKNSSEEDVHKDENSTRCLRARDKSISYKETLKPNENRYENIFADGLSQSDMQLAKIKEFKSKSSIKLLVDEQKQWTKEKSSKFKKWEDIFDTYSVHDNNDWLEINERGIDTVQDIYSSHDEKYREDASFFDDDTEDDSDELEIIDSEEDLDSSMYEPNATDWKKYISSYSNQAKSNLKNQKSKSSKKVLFEVSGKYSAHVEDGKYSNCKSFVKLRLLDLDIEMSESYLDMMNELSGQDLRDQKHSYEFSVMKDRNGTTTTTIGILDESKSLRRLNDTSLANQSVTSELNLSIKAQKVYKMFMPIKNNNKMMDTHSPRRSSSNTFRKSNCSNTSLNYYTGSKNDILGLLDESSSVLRLNDTSLANQSITSELNLSLKAKRIHKMFTPIKNNNIMTDAHSSFSSSSNPSKQSYCANTSLTKSSRMSAIIKNFTPLKDRSPRAGMKRERDDSFQNETLMHDSNFSNPSTHSEVKNKSVNKSLNKSSKIPAKIKRCNPVKEREVCLDVMPIKKCNNSASNSSSAGNKSLNKSLKMAAVVKMMKPIKGKRQSSNIKKEGLIKNDEKQFKCSHSSKIKSELKTDSYSGPDNSKKVDPVNSNDATSVDHEIKREVSSPDLFTLKPHYNKPSNTKSNFSPPDVTNFLRNISLMEDTHIFGSPSKRPRFDGESVLSSTRIDDDTELNQPSPNAKNCSKSINIRNSDSNAEFDKSCYRSKQINLDAQNTVHHHGINRNEGCRNTMNRCSNNCCRQEYNPPYPSQSPHLSWYGMPHNNIPHNNIGHNNMPNNNMGHHNMGHHNMGHHNMPNNNMGHNNMPHHMNQPPLHSMYPFVHGYPSHVPPVYNPVCGPQPSVEEMQYSGRYNNNNNGSVLQNMNPNDPNLSCVNRNSTIQCSNNNSWIGNTSGAKSRIPAVESILKELNSHKRKLKVEVGYNIQLASDDEKEN